MILRLYNILGLRMMKNVFSVPRGTSDILPDSAGLWCCLENQARRLMRIYAYQEIRTPVFEDTELFARSVGQTSDIVQKQMLMLASQASDSADSSVIPGALSLRPEGTASIVRSYIENGLARKEKLSKLFYIGPMFRGERPQKGRLRQFHQIGVEAIGSHSASPYLDAEVISLSVELLTAFGVKDFVLKLNTLGSLEDKENFSIYLRDHLGMSLNRLCPDCRGRYDRNVFRVLDCKNEGCRDIVRGLGLTFDHLSSESRDYYERLKRLLTDQGVSYLEDPCLVRGLDYYTHTVFELSCARLGSQDALGAGGRYNHLVQQLGGPEADAVGFALGIERILLATEGQTERRQDALDVFVAALSEDAMMRAVQIGAALRSAGLAVDMRFDGGSLKSQMRQANKLNARFAAMIGSEELEAGQITLKDMESGEQRSMAMDQLDEMITVVKG